MHRFLHDEGGEPADISLGWRIGQIFLVLLVGCSGLLFNLFLYSREITKPLATAVQFLKGLGAGTIIAVAMVHMLGESGESLEWLAEETGYEAWNMGFCMIAIYLFSLVDFIAKKSSGKDCIEFKLKELVLAEEEHCGHISVVCQKNEDDETEHSSSKHHKIDKDTTPRAMSPTSRVISEVSILSHSILVGVIVGMDGSTSMLIATCFHQLLEGFAYANLVTGTKKSVSKWIMIAAYSLTTLIGQVIGVVLAEDEDFSTSTAGTVTIGVLSAFCSGLLLYSALVHMLSQWVTSNKQLLAAPVYFGFVTYLGVAVGIGGMALIGKWA